MDAAIVILVIVLGVGGFAWRRRRYRQAEELRIASQKKPYENAAHDAFMLGNTCLMEGKFDDARAAFHHVINLEPKHPHVGDRLDEVERQQASASS